MRARLTPINLAFRPCVGIVVKNRDGLYWTGERLGFPGSWQFPQGGIDEDETPVDAAWRELEEETGLTKKHCRLSAECPFWGTYEVPRDRHSPFGWLGQTQRWFLFTYDGNPEDAKEIALQSRDFLKEFSDFKWQKFETLFQTVVDFKQPLYAQVHAWLQTCEEKGVPEKREYDGFLWKGLPDEIELVYTSRQYTNWIRRLDQSFTIKEINVQAVDRRHDGGLLFAKLFVKAQDSSGLPVPGAVLLRGDASAVLLVLKCAGEEYTVIVRQPRFAAGLSSTKEIPAGMLDDSGDKEAVAVREVKEETGLVIEKSDLIDLGGFYPSFGLCDEIIYLFAAEKEISPNELSNLQGRLCGRPEENERIKVELLKLRDLPTSTGDPKSLFAYWRYFSQKRN